MKKLNTLTKLTDCGVVAVVRAESEEEAIKISEACVDGGIKGIEITFTIQHAEVIIRNLSDAYKHQPDVIIGAGTVMDATTARLAILAGADYIVSPSFDEQTAKLCNLYQIPYIPGCMTIKEMKQALESGVDIIKLFPGSAFGPDYIKSVKAPLPQANLMPTGGVNLDNVGQWVENGCVAVGIGGNLIASAKTGDYRKITENAQAYVQKVLEAREER